MNAKNLTALGLKPLLWRTGLPRSVRVHDPRHKFAILMLCEGDHPKVVQEILGHAIIAVTMDTHSHALPNMQREAVNRLGAVLS